MKVNSTVVVNKDGSGDFVSINDAISAAPNNTQSSDGYYLIKVSAGLYEEYVSIAKNKKYIMMVGEGINQTIITGNHSVVDGWTTFNSATFSKYIYIYIFLLISYINYHACIYIHTYIHTKIHLFCLI